MSSIIAPSPRTVMIDGPEGRIQINDGGAGDLPIVFAHSFAGDSSHWKHQLHHLRDHRRAITFDFRSHGKSDSPIDKDLFEAEDLAGDIEAVVRHLELKKFILVGHSMGGAAAIAYTGMYPERVAGLLLAGTPGKTPADQAKVIVDSLRSDKYQEVMDQYMTRILANSSNETNDQLWRGIKRIDRETSTNIVKAMFDFDPVVILKKYSGPKLIITTAAEEHQPYTLHKILPEIPTHVIEGTSHWTMLDKPDAFNSILDQFLRTVPMNK